LLIISFGFNFGLLSFQFFCARFRFYYVIIELDMANNHSGQDHLESESNRGLAIALGITIVFMIVEVVGGLFSDSLALVSDAGHMLIDALALSLSLFALNLARRPATTTRTYGYHRAEIMAALANGVILVFVTVAIFYESYQRFLKPPEVHSGLMLIIAVLGLVANIAGMLLLRRSQHANLNIRAAFFHVFGDMISSIGVVVAAIVISLTGWTYADPLIAVLIGVIILIGAVQLVRESTDILLESAPKHIDMDKVLQVAQSIPGVEGLHDLHVWTITSGIYALSAHIIVRDVMVSNTVEILDKIRHEMEDRFGITHTTLQLECSNGLECPQGLVCHLSRNSGKEEEHE
jgi:cobalt-zinc-cadmium efflux system protein